MWEQIQALGISPGLAIAIGVTVTIALYFTKAFFERMNKAHERNEEILHEEKKRIIGLANTISKLIVDYDHFVKHLADGDSQYENKVSKWHNEIREEARKVSYMVKDECPNLLEYIYDYTDFGRGVSPSGNEYFEFNRKHVAVGKLLDKIRAKYVPGYSLP